MSSVLILSQQPSLLFDQQEYERNVSEMRSELPSQAFEKAWSKGKRMVLEQAVDFALEDSSSQSK